VERGGTNKMGERKRLINLLIDGLETIAFLRFLSHFDFFVSFFYFPCPVAVSMVTDLLALSVLSTLLISNEVKLH
jgi:hypothetical protein